jgi:2,4-dienoyl-CoA reductase-like NADH-dependent reductase (Old Yellow Enzyme family)
VTDLLSPLVFRNGQQAPNRVWLAPMTNTASHADGRLSDDELGFLVNRAAGGFGVVETCATHVTEDGQAWAGQLGLFADGLVEGWRRLAAAVHAEGGALLIGQAFHGGRKTLRGPERPTPWSCSASLPGEPEVREGSEEQIEALIEAFAAGARRLEQAGAHGVELHGAHGYLLCQFLSSELNRRGDGWGGSLENRARLLRRTLQATRAAVGSGFVVGVRLSPESYDGLPGIDLDESLQVARWLCEDGADVVHLSLWDGTRNTTKHPDVHPARLFRDALPPEVPIVTAGGVWTLADAQAQLEHGADAVALGKAAIANPAWPRAVAKEGQEPDRFPLSAADLRARALGEPFVDYLRKWPDLVSES